MRSENEPVQSRWGYDKRFHGTIPTITNFQKDWKNGKVLFALLDSLDPGTLPITSMDFNPHTSLIRAFDVALTEFAIPKLLNPGDILNSTYKNEFVAMMYITCIRSATFSPEFATRRGTSMLIKALWQTCGSIGLFDKLPREILFVVFNHICAPFTLAPQRLAKILFLSQQKFILAKAGKNNLLRHLTNTCT
eukprot:TRINITY_DN13355_c0_g1_i1.p1 TRINITY_DN13355_c0_g1~~TRINITY_DN13355_c0_g1_i1.p1  ORF type:complete len:211 (-),score=10.50 TRINITY_DN13355_c0_g1_i1:266-841(-)